MTGSVRRDSTYWLTSTQTARLLGFSVSWVNGAADKGLIPCSKFGTRSRLFRLQKVVEFADEFGVPIELTRAQRETLDECGHKRESSVETPGGN